MIVEIDGVRFDVPDDATTEEIGALTAPAPAKTSRGEALARGVLQGGSLLLGDEAAGASAAIGKSAQSEFKRTPGPRSLKLLYPGLPYEQAAARWFEENRPDVSAAQSAEAGRAQAGDTYTRVRDDVRAGNRKAREDRPGWYLAGELGGGVVPSLAAPGVASGGTLGARMLAAVKSAVPVGAAYGFGGSEAPTIAGQALDTAVGGVGAGLVAGAIPPIAAGIGSAAGRVRDRLEQTALNQGRKVLTGNAAPMATRKPLSDEAVRAAYDAGAIRPFGTAEKARDVLDAARESTGDLYGQILAALESKGITGPNAQDLAAALEKEARQSWANSLGSPRPAMFREVAQELTGVPGNPSMPPKPTDLAGNLGLTQGENMRRALQRGAMAEYKKEGAQSLSGEAKTDLASLVRQSVEDAVDAQASKAPAEAAAFVPVKRKLSAIIEGSNAARTAAARAANRQQFGLGSKVLASGALASGSLPGAAAALFGSTALRNRGPATIGSLADFFAAGAGRLANVTPTQTQRVGVTAGATAADELASLVDLLRGGRGLRWQPAAADEEGDRSGGR